jgi:putative hemolysin
LLDFLIVFLCLFINAIFSAYEMAFVTISKEEVLELEHDHKKTSKNILKFKNRPERTLSVIQIGITLVGAVAAAVGGTGAVESLEPYLMNKFGISSQLAEAIAVTVVILPLTYFSVVFGELIPKTIALRHPQKVLLLGTKLLNFIDNFLSPVITFLEISTNFILKKFGFSSTDQEVENLSMSIDIGSLPGYHQRFVQNLIDLKGKRIAKSFVPKERVTYIEFSDTDAELENKIHHNNHSRFPVIDGDTIVGILHKKELLEALRVTHVPWRGILLAAVKVKESDKVLEAFLRMQEKHQHLAIVTNEEGIFTGIITIEDIIEQIVGNINDDIDKNRIAKMLAHRSKIQLPQK